MLIIYYILNLLKTTLELFPYTTTQSHNNNVNTLCLINILFREVF